MNAYVFALIMLGILAVSIALTIWCSPRGDAPKVKSHDAIAEEVRRERLELHNTSREYAELQLRNGLDQYPRSFVDAMLSAAFRQGAKWQQRQP